MQGFFCSSIRGPGVRLLACAALATSAAACLAGGTDCRFFQDDVQLCVTWSQELSDPLHGTDYEVTFSGAGVPSVALITGEEWEVFAEILDNGTPTGVPADIASVTIDPSSSSENFVVMVTMDGEAGADDIGTIDLTAGGWSGSSSTSYPTIIDGNLTGNVRLANNLQLRIYGDMSGDIDVPIIEDLEISGTLSGDITVTDALEGTLDTYGSISSTSDITIPDIAGSAISLSWFGAEFGEAFDGHLELEGGVPNDALVIVGAIMGEGSTIDLRGQDVAGQLFLNGGDGSVLDVANVSFQFRLTSYAESSFRGLAEVASVTSEGEIVVLDGDLEGELAISGDMDGLLLVDGANVTESGRIMIGDDCTGLITIQTYETVGGSMYGRIAIDGSLEETAEIAVDDELGDTGAITVDYDGWDDGDDWNGAAPVTVGANTYYANSPADHVWEVLECKGDMNNDGSLNYFDTDPWLMALYEPSAPGVYEEAFPGLEGSMVYHGDFVSTCDVIQFFDADGFLEVIQEQCCLNECCESNCEDLCQSFGPGGGMSAEATAAMIEVYVDPARIAALVELVTQSSEEIPEGTQEFWADVAAALQE